MVVAGPTAAGKSALALALAEALARDGAAATLIAADAMQVYRELAVLTARPTAAERARAPHRLYGYVPAAQACSVGRWRGDALTAIAAARAAGRLPVVVGGSGLYIEALIEGLAPVPPVPASARRRADALRDSMGAAAFHAALAARDPAAARLAAGDTQRVKRAWEVLEATGRPLAAWTAAPRLPLPGPVLRILLWPERDPLYRRCAERFEGMMARGALEEARALAALELDPALPAMKALGVRPLLACLAGAIDRRAAVERAVRETRRYAKRQRTWLRRRYRADLTVAPGPGFPAAEAALCRGAVHRFMERALRMERASCKERASRRERASRVAC